VSIKQVLTGIIPKNQKFENSFNILIFTQHMTGRERQRGY